MQDKYLRCGGVFEFSLETKRRLMLEDATKLTFSNLFATQDAVLEPILNYWLVVGAFVVTLIILLLFLF